MLIALLAVLGVDLLTIAVVLAVVLTRRAWVSHQAGAFRGAIRVTDGQVHGLHAKWKRGSGRWVSDVLVWAKAPFLFRNEFVVAARATAQVRPAVADDKVKRLGREPVIVAIAAGEAHIEVATAAHHQEQVLGSPAAAGNGSAADHRAPTSPRRHAN